MLQPRYRLYPPSPPLPLSLSHSLVPFPLSNDRTRINRTRRIYAEAEEEQRVVVEVVEAKWRKPREGAPSIAIRFERYREAWNDRSIVRRMTSSFKNAPLRIWYRVIGIFIYLCTRGMPSNRARFTDDPSTIDAFQRMMHNHSPSCSIFSVNPPSSLLINALRSNRPELSRRCDDDGGSKGWCPRSMLIARDRGILGIILF